MKDTPQDSQSFDAAFDARCRELLQSRSVAAPDFVEPVPPAAGQGRRVALVAGAVITIGIGAALGPSGQPEAVEAPMETATPSMTTAEPKLQPAAPAMASSAYESTTGSHAAEAAVAQPEESTVVTEVQEEAVATPARDVAATEAAASSAESTTRSPDMDPVSSAEGDAESIPEQAAIEAVEGTERPESTLLDEATESVEGVPTDSPSAEPVLPAMEEPAAAPQPANEPEEPTLRLPLTLPAGGGQ